jgi:hypothetical protein
MEDIFKGMQNVREMKRKRAVEEAIRKGVGPDGIMNPDNIRQSLAASGFGENADEVVREISMKRQGDVKSTAELGVMLKGLVDGGYINEAKARELYENTVLSSPRPSTKIADSESQIMADAASFVGEGEPQSQTPITQPTGSPGAGTTRSVVGETEAIIRPEGDIKPTGGEYKLQDIGPQTEQSRRAAQATPDYAADLINWGKKPEAGVVDSGNISTTTFDYMLPTETRDLEETLTAYQRLGYDIKDPTSESIDAQITKRALAIAGPAPVMTPGYNLADITKNTAEYNQRMREWVAKISEAKQSQVDAVSKERAGKFGEVQSKEAQDFGLGGQKGKDGKPLPLFYRDVSAPEAAEVKKQRAAIDDISTANIATFEGQYKAALAKAKADGSVNQDAIMANLVAMGAVPSSSALYLKQLMTPGGNWKSEGIGVLKQVLASLSESDKKQASSNATEWQRDAISNINQYIQDNGGNPYVRRKSAADSLRDMADGGATRKTPNKPKRTSAGM